MVNTDVTLVDIISEIVDGSKKREYVIVCF